MPSVTLLWLISLWTMQENRCYFTQVFFGMYSYHILASTIFWNSCNPGLLFNFFSLFLRQVFRIIPAPNDQLSYSFIPNNFTKLWFTFLFFTSIRKDIWLYRNSNSHLPKHRCACHLFVNFFVFFFLNFRHITTKVVRKLGSCTANKLTRIWKILFLFNIRIQDNILRERERSIMAKHPITQWLRKHHRMKQLQIEILFRQSTVLNYLCCV